MNKSDKQSERIKTVFNGAEIPVVSGPARRQCRFLCESTENPFHDMDSF